MRLSLALLGLVALFAVATAQTVGVYNLEIPSSGACSSLVPANLYLTQSGSTWFGAVAATVAGTTLVVNGFTATASSSQFTFVTVANDANSVAQFAVGGKIGFDATSVTVSGSLNGETCSLVMKLDSSVKVSVPSWVGSFSSPVLTGCPSDVDVSSSVNVFGLTAGSATLFGYSAPEKDGSVTLGVGTVTTAAGQNAWVITASTKTSDIGVAGLVSAGEISVIQGGCMATWKAGGAGSSASAAAAVSAAAVAVAALLL